MTSSDNKESAHCMDGAGANPKSSEKSGHLEVRIRRVGKPDNAAISLLIDASKSVSDLKERISDELSGESDYVPVERQRLIYCGRIVKDEESLGKDLRMKPEVHNFIHLSPLPEGAKPSSRNAKNPSILRRIPEAQVREHLRAALQQRSSRRIRRLNQRSTATHHPYIHAIPSRIVSNQHDLRLLGPFQSNGGLNIDQTRLGLESEGRSPEGHQNMCPVGSFPNLTVPPSLPSTSSLVSMLNMSQHSQTTQAVPANSLTVLLQHLRTSRDVTGNAAFQRLLLSEVEPGAHAARPDPGIDGASRLALLRELLRTSPSTTQQEHLVDVLDQISRNAGDVAMTLRVLLNTNLQRNH